MGTRNIAHNIAPIKIESIGTIGNYWKLLETTGNYLINGTARQIAPTACIFATLASTLLAGSATTIASQSQP